MLRKLVLLIVSSSALPNPWVEGLEQLDDFEQVYEKSRSGISLQHRRS